MKMYYIVNWTIIDMTNKLNFYKVFKIVIQPSCWFNFSSIIQQIYQKVKYQNWVFFIHIYIQFLAEFTPEILIQKDERKIYKKGNTIKSSIVSVIVKPLFFFRILYRVKSKRFYTTYLILNIFSLETRKIYISEPRSTIKLGLYIRYESINPLILHITKVLKGSPAESSGLKSNQDYLLGVKSHRYQSIDEFSDIVTGQAYSKQLIELCIFSPLTKKSPRVIVLEPKFNWGGPGALGCEFASGALHSFNFSQLIKPQEVDDCREGLNNEENQQQQIEEQKQQQQFESREQNEMILNNQEDQQIELNKSLSLDKINDVQEHSIDKALSLSCSQISESKQNSKIQVQQEIQQNVGFEQQQLINQIDMKNSQHIDESSILADLDNQQKQQSNYDQIQSDILLPETPTNFGQQDSQFENGIDEQGDVTKFKGVLRFQKEGQEPYLEKEEVKQIDHLNSSFQLKNASSDYSHLEQNKNEIQVQLQSTVSQQDNESKNVVVKYVNQLVFKSPKREQMYVVDKKLLFDIQFEVPKYYVNIY